MSFQTIFPSALVASAVASASILASAPAEAANIAVGSTINLSSPSFFVTESGVKRDGNTLDFYNMGTIPLPPFLGGPIVIDNQRVGVNSGTGSFNNANVASLYPPLPTIKDLTLVSNGGGLFSINNPVIGFISGLNLFDGFPPSSVRFDLTSFLWNSTTGDASLKGFFVSGADSTAAQGLFTSQLNFTAPSPSSYSLSIQAVPEAIPTPALLPGLIGMGVAALRRKQDEEGAEENA